MCLHIIYARYLMTKFEIQPQSSLIEFNFQYICMINSVGKVLIELMEKY